MPDISDQPMSHQPSTTSEISTKTKPFIEVVQTNDGQQEDRIVFGGLFVMLLSAALLLSYLYPGIDNDFVPIPKALRASLTSLSNAGEEIAILREFENHYPSIEELKSAAVEPFSSVQLKQALAITWQHQGNCYLGTASDGEHDYQLRLRLDNAVQPVQWRVITHEVNAHKHTLADIVDASCQSDASVWHSAATLAHDTLSKANLHKDGHHKDSHAH